MARRKRLTVEAILRATATHFNTTPEEITVYTRKREVVRPRQIAQHIAWDKRVSVLRQIAQKTGVKQHGTVLHSHSLIRDECEMYSGVKEDVNEITQRLSLMGYNMEIEKPIKAQRL